MGHIDGVTFLVDRGNVSFIQRAQKLVRIMFGIMLSCKLEELFISFSMFENMFSYFADCSYLPISEYTDYL